MFHLVFKQGLHTWNTHLLLVILFRLKNIAKQQHADVQAYPVDEDTIAMSNAPNKCLDWRIYTSASYGTHCMGANRI
jgi:hypothetical protein